MNILHTIYTCRFSRNSEAFASKSLEKHEQELSVWSYNYTNHSSPKNTHTNIWLSCYPVKLVVSSIRVEVLESWDLGSIPGQGIKVMKYSGHYLVMFRVL